MKKLILGVAALLLLTQTQVVAQETEPLAMRVTMEWSLVGTGFGAVIGAMFWLTDPANPNNRFSEQVIEGAALGAIAGVGMGIYALRRSAIFPGFAYFTDPLHPSQRITADPVGDEARREGSFASSFLGQGSGTRGWRLPMLKFKF